VLLKVLPSEGLYLENGVGKTPYEDAEKRAMKPMSETVRTCDPPSLGRDAEISTFEDVKVMEKGLQDVTETLQLLFSNGVLQKGSTLSNSFERFVSASQGRLVKLRKQAVIAKNEAEGKENETKSSEVKLDEANAIQTFNAIAKVVGPNTAKRTLIHLKDVQKSVAIDLGRVGGREAGILTGDGPEDEEPEESEDKGVIRRSITTSSDNW
jgi:hypothetical protein